MTHNFQIFFFIKKISILTFFFYLLLNPNYYSNAHIRGTFFSEEEAIKESLNIGCKGIHKNKDKWLPCANEKELHKYLRK